MKHALHPDVLREYVAAASAYEERQPGLGDRFIQSVEGAIESICQAPSADYDLFRRERGEVDLSQPHPFRDAQVFRNGFVREKSERPRIQRHGVDTRGNGSRGFDVI